MMLRLFTWLVSKYRPTLMSPLLMVWLVVNWRVLAIAAVIRMRNKSECEFDIIKRDTWFAVLKGEMLYHVSDDDYDDPRTAWTYTDPEYGKIRVLHLKAGARMRLYPGDAVFIELFKATNTEQRLLDFPNWMSAEDFQRDTDRQAWVAVIAVGPELLQEKTNVRP